MSLMQPLIDLVNSFGNSVTSSVEAVLGINHVLASGIVALITFVFNLIT
jgi:hypothetical protein